MTNKDFTPVHEKQKREWLSVKQKEDLLKRFPLFTVSAILILTMYFMLWHWIKISSLMLSHYYRKEMFILPLLFGRSEGVGIWWIPVVAIVSIFGWLLSTRVPLFKKRKWRITTFSIMILANVGALIGLGMTQMQKYVLPFFYQRLDRVIDTSDAIQNALFEQVDGFFFSLVSLPLLFSSFLLFFVITKYRQHDQELKNAFFQFEWRGEWLRRFENLSKIDSEIIPLPDVELGLSRKWKEMIVLPGKDRTLNTIITGSIGTGKTAALGLPMINQDLHHITRFMNDFPTTSRRADYLTENIQGRYLNGLSVIDPSNDLCKKVYRLAKAHNIPDEAITYIDPTNPNTPNINPMQGPVDKVAEVFAQVIAGLADSGGGGNFFFEQAQRNHLKQHIYLLKMHNPEKEVTFDMLIDMYNDTYRVHEMHMELKEQFPPDYEKIDKVKFRDEYNHWQILKGIDEWFDNTIVPKEMRTPQGTFPMRDDKNRIIYTDAEAEYVKGLRNILNDIGANPLIRRVLFGPSKFNFDEHMGSAGGILLVHTAKGELEALGSVLGKIVLMTLQNASFRREPNISPYHHILVDEAPEYLYSAFASFPAQSRKYKVILTILQQTLTQLRGAFGEDYMNTVVAAMRNRMVYADVSAFDSKYFAEMFGEKKIYEESEQETSVSALQDNPVSRSGVGYSKVTEEAMSSSEILFQEAFECAVKIVVDNQTMPVIQIKANFVPDEEFENAIMQVEPEAAAEWIRIRYNDIVQVIEDATDEELESMISLLVEQPQSINETISDKNKINEMLNQAEIEQAIQTEKPTRPIERKKLQANTTPTIHIPNRKIETPPLTSSIEKEEVHQVREIEKPNRKGIEIQEEVDKNEQSIQEEQGVQSITSVSETVNEKYEQFEDKNDAVNTNLEDVDLRKPRKILEKDAPEEKDNKLVKDNTNYQKVELGEKEENFYKDLYN